MDVGRGVKLPLTPEDLSEKGSERSKARIDEISHHPGSYSIKKEMRRSIYQKSVVLGPLLSAKKIKELTEEKKREENNSAWSLPTKESESPVDEQLSTQDEAETASGACKKCEELNRQTSEDSETSSKQNAEPEAAPPAGSEQSSSDSYVTQTQSKAYCNDEELELFTWRSSENSDFTAARTSWKSESESDETTATFSDRRLYWSTARKKSKVSESSDSPFGIETESSEVSRYVSPETLRTESKAQTGSYPPSLISTSDKYETEETKSAELAVVEKISAPAVISKQQRIENFRKSKKMWNYALRRSDDFSFGSFEFNKNPAAKSMDELEISSTRLKEEVGLPVHLSRNSSSDRYTFARLEKILTSFDSDPFEPSHVRDFESFCDAVMFGKKPEPKEQQGDSQTSQTQEVEETAKKLVDSSAKSKRKEDLSQKLKCLLL